MYYVPRVTPVFFLIPFLPAVPHLPAFGYGVYTRTDRVSKGVLGQKENYLLAFSISALLSFFAIIYTLGVCSPGRMYPVWYIDVSIVAAALLIPTFHIYSEYEGDFREVILLVLIYAPWVQFVRLLMVYAQFL